MSACWARCVYLGRGRWTRAFREMTKRLCLSQGGWPVLQPGRKGAKRRPHVSRSSWPQSPGAPALTAPHTLGEASLRCPSTDAPVSPGGQGRAPPGAPLTPAAAAQPSWGLRGQRVPGRSRQTQATGKGAETLPGSLGPGLWAHAQCPLERGRGTLPQGPANSAGRQGPRGQKHTLAHPCTRSLPHPSRHPGQLPRRGAGSGLTPQLALKIHSAPSGSRPRKLLFTRSLPAARAGWQLALASAGSSWLGGWEEVMLPADTWREAAWPGRLPAGPCGRVHGRCTPPLPGARRTLAAGTKTQQRTQTQKDGDREEGRRDGRGACSRYPR